MGWRHVNRAAAFATAPAFAASLLAGCATTIEAPPAPIDPAATARMLTARSLSDPGIAEGLSRMGIRPGAPWTLDSLTVAAWSLRSDISVAAADIAEGTAAEAVAGLRPNPTLSFDPSFFLTNLLDDPSPWVFATALSYTIERGDKRNIRVAQARADTETRRWRLAELLWQARTELRRAMVARALADRSIALAENELSLHQAYADWVETQIRFGLGTGPSRLIAQTNIARAQAQLRAAQSERVTADAQIAAAAGIPAENLAPGELAPLALDTLPAPDSIDLGALRDMGIGNRLTVRHALADYAVTEEALRAAVARQYPDLNIGPGYTFDRGDHAITLPIGLTIPLAHDERDAIAQAVAVRARAAAQFEAAQSLALSEIGTASARYRASYATLAETRTGEDIARRGVQEAQRRLMEGGADRGEVLTAQIVVAAADRASLDALRNVADALGALEDGVQRPIFPPSNLTMRRPDQPNPEPMP